MAVKLAAGCSHQRCDHPAAGLIGIVIPGKISSFHNVRIDLRLEVPMCAHHLQIAEAGATQHANELTAVG